LMLARRGRRTLAVEMEPGGRLAGLLGREADPRLSVLHVDGRAALEEYLNLVIPVKRLLATVLQSKIYQYFVAAAPGLKELMTVGKIWYEATRTEGGRPRGTRSWWMRRRPATASSTSACRRRRARPSAPAWCSARRRRSPTSCATRARPRCTW